MIPGVWVSTDHQCIVWCNQLVSCLSSLMLSWADVRSQLATVPVRQHALEGRSKQHIGVLHNHLLRPSALSDVDKGMYKPRGMLNNGICMSTALDDAMLQDKQMFQSGDELHLKAGDLKVCAPPGCPLILADPENSCAAVCVCEHK